VIHRAHHLQEDGLFDCYLAERSGEAIAPPVVEHLADCESCGARYAEMARLMDALRADGETATDAIFTPERLRAQHQQIARRIEHVGRSARVISFPGRLVHRTLTGSTSRTAPRWAAAAAAAGLFVGVGLGAGGYQWGAHARAARQTVTGITGRASRLTPVAVHLSGPPDTAADDAFLSELEIALERPHTHELRAFDAFTPHVREIRDAR
jgi:hypothetical protein